MQAPLQITFRDVPHSRTVEARIRGEAEKLDKIHPNIIACRVVLHTPHRHHHKGNLFHTSVHLTIAGAEFNVTREPSEHREHEDVYVSIRDAFRETARQLEDYVHKRIDRHHGAAPPHRS